MSEIKTENIVKCIDWENPHNLEVGIYIKAQAELTALKARIKKLESGEEIPVWKTFACRSCAKLLDCIRDYVRPDDGLPCYTAIKGMEGGGK
jgi:hypothetical protein